MDIDNLEAGPELDALVAEKVMGCKVIRLPNEAPGGDRNDRLQDSWVCECSDDHPHGHYDNCCRIHEKFLANYSTDIAAAWDLWSMVLGKVGAHRFLWTFDGDGGIEIEHFEEGYIGDLEHNSGDWRVSGPAPLAICRAALKTAS